MQRLVFFLIVAFGTGAIAVGVGGCASGTITKIEDTAALPEDLGPGAQKQKFEVKEGTALAPLPAASPEPSPFLPLSEGKRKKKKRGKEPIEEKTSDLASLPPTPGASGKLEYPSRHPAKEPFKVGEELLYEISYFGVPAGYFTLDVLPYKSINDRKVYHIQATAESSKVFSLFYRLNDTIETFMDYDGLYSHRFHLVLDESKQTRNSLEINDSEKAQTFFWNRWNKQSGYTETKTFTPIQPFSQDSLSALYYLRTIPLPDGSVTTFPVVSEGKVWDAVITVIRREMVDSPFGRVQAVVVRPSTKYQGVLQNKGDSFIWLTDDSRRIVLRLEAKVRIGTVVATLKKAQPGQ